MSEIKSNGTSSSRRRESRAAAGQKTAAAESAAATSASDQTDWLMAVDALAAALAGLSSRETILESLVRETMRLLPVETVIVRADAPAELLAASAAADQEPDRAAIALTVDDRQHGVVEIAMKTGGSFGPGERALAGALVRQAALALDRLSAGPAARSSDRGGAAAAFDRVAADISALAALARSAALPPAHRVNEVEKTATEHLAQLRVRLTDVIPDEPSAYPAAAP
jgi:hypothetical protein